MDNKTEFEIIRLYGEIVYLINNINGVTNIELINNKYELSINKDIVIFDSLESVYQFLNGFLYAKRNMTINQFKEVEILKEKYDYKP